ncbi:MAG: gamma-glutamyltransferase [Kofleriaceae bacterium]|nr:gamma-glutamyltransferase [Kofleriaceae bacterium]
MTRLGKLCIGSVATLLAGAAPTAVAQNRTAAVATDHQLATEAAAKILAQGGNAADAAVTAALALGVINPTSSGIGGGGFAVVYDAKTKQVRVYDFREMAPASLDPSDFVSNGKVDTSKAQRGGLAVGVPGEVAGLALLAANHGQFGRDKAGWKKLVLPAERLAQNGFAVSHFTAGAANAVAGNLPVTATFAPLRTLLQPSGKPLKAAQRLRRPALAKTLRAIAAKGAAGFYSGDVAADLVATTSADGGVMTVADLAAYQVIEREPLRGQWRGYSVATMPLPSSGGLVLLETLAILDATATKIETLPADGADYMHLLTEALKHGFADRARWLGDSADAATVTKRMLDPGRVRDLAARIDMKKTLPAERYGGAGNNKPVKADDHGTSHLCVIDADGNAVALTTTVNGFFGSKLLSKTGVVLNNEMDDFAIVADTANQFGLMQSSANLVAGGKRPLSSMTPTLLLDSSGAVVGCAGGSGGPLIISGTIQVLLNSFVLGLSAGQAVAAPRLHHQWSPDQLLVQQPGAAVVSELRKRGHVVIEQAGEAIEQFIRVLPDGSKQPASDPGKGGVRAAQVVRVKAPR